MQNWPTFGVALCVIIAFAPARDSRAESLPNECRCVTTYFEGDVHHNDVHCEGFNAAVHERCECEKVKIDGQNRPIVGNVSSSVIAPVPSA